MKIPRLKIKSFQKMLGIYGSQVGFLVYSCQIIPDLTFQDPELTAEMLRAA